MEKLKIRTYMCGKCGGRNAPPTGKKCMEVAAHASTVKRRLNLCSPASTTEAKRIFLERSAGAKSPSGATQQSDFGRSSGEIIQTMSDTQSVTNDQSEVDKQASLGDVQSEHRLSTQMLISEDARMRAVDNREAVSKSDLWNFMTEIKAMIAGTNERVGTIEVKLARGNMPDTVQKVVETVEKFRNSYKNGAAENINHASLDTGLPAFIADIRYLITDRQKAVSGKKGANSRKSCPSG